MKKSTLILVAMAVALVGLILYNRMGTQGQKPMSLPKLEAEVSQVLIEKASEDEDDEPTSEKATIDLQKKDGEWLIGEQRYLADKSKVENLINEVKKSRRIDRITDLQTTDYKYELDEPNRMGVMLMDDAGNSIRTLYLGKKSPSGNHVYLKKDADSSIYSTIDSLTSIMDVEADSLRDKKIFSFQSSGVRALSLEENGTNILIGEAELKDEANEEEGDDKKEVAPRKVWQDQESNEYDESKVKRILSILSGLQAEGFSDEAIESLQEGEVFRKWSVTANNETHTLVILKDKKDDQWLAYAPNRRFGFFLKKSDEERLTEALKELRKQEKS